MSSVYKMSYKIEIVEREDPIAHLEASKSCIKNLFGDFLDERRSFKYQVTVNVLLKKYKPNRKFEFSPAYFN